MTKTILVALVTAVIGYAAGFWTAGTFAGHRVAEASVVTPSAMSPLEMHRNVKPHDLPAQYMRGDFN